MPLVYTTNYLYFSFSIVYHSPDICLWIGWTLSVWSQAHCWNISSVSSVDLPKSTINANIWKTCAKLWAPQHWCRRQSTSRHSGAPPCPSARPPQHPRSYSACASIVETVWIKNSTIFKNVLVSWYIQMKLKIVLTNLFVNSAMSRSQSEEQLRMFSDDVDLWEFFPNDCCVAFNKRVRSLIKTQFFRSGRLCILSKALTIQICREYRLKKK